MRKNAQLQSKTEIVNRLIAGEVFYTQTGAKCWYDPTISGSPFRFRPPAYKGSDAMSGVWNEYDKLEVEVNWYDNIPPEGIVCAVSDDSQLPSSAYKNYSVVASKIEKSYHTKGGAEWRFAVPLNLTQDFGPEGRSL